jgi:hypothetical protein
MRKAVTPLAVNKERCRRAYHLARAADPRSSALFDRLYADTLTAATGQPAERSAIMFHRMSICLEVLADRTGWPERMR